MKIEVTAAAAGAGASLIAGTILGLPIAALFAGFFGGVTSMSLAQAAIAGWWARVGTLVGSTATAGFVAPYAAARLHADGVDPLLEILAIGFILGAGLQVLMPRLIAAIANRIDQAGGVSK